MDRTDPPHDEPVVLPGSVFLITSDGRMLHLPIPSLSRSDPLNWSVQKRVLALGSLFFFTITGLVQMQGASLLGIALKAEYVTEDMWPFQLEILTSSASIFMGVGAFLWIPLSIAFGRRPVLLLCTILLLVGTVWAGFSGSFYQHLAARSFQGLAVGACISTILLTIIDLTYIHQRPQAIASFWSLGAVFSNLAILSTSEIISAENAWRAFYWVWISPSIISVFLAFLFCHETYFQRPAVAFDGRVLVQSGSENVTVYNNWQEVPGGKELPEIPDKSKWWALMNKLKVWQKGRAGGLKAMKACLPQIVLCLLNPLIFWVTLLNALIFGSQVATSATYVALLSGSPYNLSARTINLVQVSCAIGALLAWPASGIMTQHICRRLAVRNKGVREAEHYLPAFILPVLTGTASVILYGLVGQFHWHWIWIFILAGLNYFGFISLFTANTLWATEAFPRWAAAAIVAVGGGSYVISFWISLGLSYWVQVQGFATPMCVLGGLIFATGFVGIPLSFCGRRWRQFTYARWGMNEGGSLRPR